MLEVLLLEPYCLAAAWRCLHRCIINRLAADRTGALANICGVNVLTHSNNSRLDKCACCRQVDWHAVGAAGTIGLEELGQFTIAATRHDIQV